jgi:hypothetical protein
VCAFRDQAVFKKPNTSTQELDPFPQQQNTPGKNVKDWIGCFIQGAGTLMHPGSRQRLKHIWAIGTTQLRLLTFSVPDRLNLRPNSPEYKQMPRGHF